MFIYKLTNTINNKIYIGLTTEKSIEERCRKRNAEAKYRLSRTSSILNAIRKYGFENFKVEQLDTALNLEELKQKEIYYIKLYNSTNRKIGYNLTEGGEGNKGLKMSDKTKDKIRQKALGRKWSEERKLKHSILLKSKNIDYSKAKENCRKHCIETSIKVAKYSLTGDFITVYNSITETAYLEKLDRIGLTAYLKTNKFENKKGYKGYLYKKL